MRLKKEKALRSLIAGELLAQKEEILRQWLHQREELTKKYNEIIDDEFISDCRVFLEGLGETFKTQQTDDFRHLIRETVTKRIYQGFDINELETAIRLWRKIIIEHFVAQIFKAQELAQLKEMIYTTFDLVLETISEHATVLLYRRVKDEQEHTRMSHERFAKVFDRAPVGIITLDKTGLILDMNPYYRNLFYPGKESDIEQKPDIHAGETELFKQTELHRHLNKLLIGMPFTVEQHKVKTPAGKSLHVNIKGVPLFSAKDKMEGAVVMVEDITEETELQEAILKRADQLEVINQISKVISSTLKMDELFAAIINEIQKVIKLDRATIGLLGKMSDEFQVITLYPERDQPTVEKGLKKKGTSAEWVIEHRRAHVVGDLREDGRFREDNLLFEEGIRSYINIPLFARDRSVGSFSVGSRFVNAYDEEDLRNLEQISGHIAIAIENALMYSEIQTFNQVLEEEVEIRTKEVREIRDYLNLIIESSGDAVLVVDKKGAITIFNKAAEKLSGFSAPEIVGTDDLPFLGNRGLIKKVLRHGKTTMAETQVISKSEDTIPVRLSLAQLKTQANEVLGVVGIMRDLRLEKGIEEQFIQAEKLSAIGKLAADIAHEVNNPLSIIKTSIRILSDKQEHDSDSRRNFRVINEEIDRIARIIKNLLEFYRPLSVEASFSNINNIIQDLLILIEKQLNKKKINVKTSLDTSIPEILISPDQFKQVMFNLIRNAEDSMPDGGTMTIETSRNEENVRLVVKDTGCGIEPEHIGNLFVPFFTTKKEGKGTGLGLSVTYGIVKNIGGTIDIQSTPGQGAMFIVNLPCESINHG